MITDNSQLPTGRDEITERAYQEAWKQWQAEAKPDSNISRFFFCAGAQLGIELAESIHRRTYER